MAPNGPDTTASAPALHVYRATKCRIGFADFWTSRGVARMIAIRDMKAKYKQAALGPIWLLLAPAGMLAAVVIGYSSVTKTGTGGAPYVCFALVGLTVWTYIQLSVTLGAQAILGNSSLVRRSPIPRTALVSGSLIGNLPPVTIMFALTLGLTVALKGLPVQALLLPIMVIWLLFFTLCVAMLFASLAARFRDAVSVLPLVIQAGIFVSPVGYSLHGAPSTIYTLLAINPVTGLIEAWRWALLGIPDPKWTVVAIAGAWTVLVAILGWRVFSRLEVEFADVV
ncbi:MAG: hypothetical protein E6G56_09640 [Actinobacteria bacterium]|nr:MAG: hypothetical protein E6G56_09640 [Actinomycetota bacterium]